MTDRDGEAMDWTVRGAVYAHIVATGRPPSAAEVAATLGIDGDDALAAYRRLNERHALFLEPGGDTIRMAHPFSGVPTPFQVHVEERRCWANCAWDALGIPAALHADATVAAVYAEDDAPLALSVRSGEVVGPSAVVHFQVPFRRWYDDLIHT